MNFSAERDRIESLKSDIKFLRRQKQVEEERIAKGEEVLANSKNALEVLQLVAQTIQQKAHEKISEVVSSCLSAVFDDPYTFKIDFEMKQGRTEAKLQFVRRGMEVDPLTASGGGVIDTAAFALRVACLVLHRPRLSRLVVLDEPFKFVSEEYRDNIRVMLEKLSQDLGLQIIMVTHINELITGKVIEI